MIVATRDVALSQSRPHPRAQPLSLVRQLKPHVNGLCALVGDTCGVELHFDLLEALGVFWQIDQQRLRCSRMAAQRDEQRGEHAAPEVAGAPHS